MLQQDWSAISLRRGGYGPLDALHVPRGELLFCLHSRGCGRVVWWSQDRGAAVSLDFPDLELDTIARALGLPVPVSPDELLRAVEDPLVIQWLIDLLTLHLTICGHADAATAFVRRWSDGMRARVRHHGLAVDDQYDLLQDFWVRLLGDCGRRLRTVRDPRALPAWMMRVIDWLALDHSRRNRWRADWIDPNVDPDDLSAPGWESRLIVELAVEAKLALLPPREREVMQMLYEEGLTAREASEDMGISVDAVRALAYRARQRLIEHGGVE